MAIVSPDATLTDLDGCNFTRLVRSLQKDDSWLKVAEFVQIFNQNEISSLSETACPAKNLLDEFGTRLTTINTLAFILRKCGLYDALSIISEPEPMQIIRQPTSILQDRNKLSIKLGDALELEFAVAGVPPPKFQWFKDDEILADQIGAVLRYDRFLPDMEGEYVCCARQEVNLSPPSKINSEAVKVETLPLACMVLEMPDEFVYLCEGSPVLLKLKVVGYPKPTFQWLHQNTVLENENEEVLFIKRASKKHSGEYRCFISNRVSEVTVKINVIIYSENTFNVYNEPVSDKMALLIANDDYTNLENLTSPSNDVCTIAQILQTLGFKTICLQNLNLRELKVATDLFANLVKEDSFAFFYYAGHGFEMGDRFLLPTDSADVNNFRKVDALSESRILQKILDKHPVLFVFLLDMCLKLPDRLENPTIYEEVLDPYTFEPNRNLIRGYSTTSHLASYEKENSSNGIYVNTLRNYLGESLPILMILGKVNTEIASECPEQMPSISYITAQDFCLNNAVKGFYQDEQKIYKALNIETEEARINGAKIRMSKYKEVFNNVLEITILDAEEYCLCTTEVVVIEEIKDDKIILRIDELQRLGKTSFFIELKVNGVNFEISKRFEIANKFLDA